MFRSFCYRKLLFSCQVRTERCRSADSSGLGLAPASTRFFYLVFRETPFWNQTLEGFSLFHSVVETPSSSKWLKDGDSGSGNDHSWRCPKEDRMPFRLLNWWPAFMWFPLANKPAIRSVEKSGQSSAMRNDPAHDVDRRKSTSGFMLKYRMLPIGGYGGKGLVRPTPLFRAPLTPTSCSYQRQLDKPNKSRLVDGGSSGKRSSYSSLSGPDSNTTVVPVSLKPTAAALEKTKCGELMDDKQVAAAASKLRKLLAPAAKASHREKPSSRNVIGGGVRQPYALLPSTLPLHGSSPKYGTSTYSLLPEGGSTTLSTGTYVHPPSPTPSPSTDSDVGFPSSSFTTGSTGSTPSSSSLSSLSSFSPPSDLLCRSDFSKPFDAFGTTGFPSRRPRIPISKWQQQEFEEAFEAAEAVLQEEEREEEERKKEMKRKKKLRSAAANHTMQEEEEAPSTASAPFPSSEMGSSTLLPPTATPHSEEALPSIATPSYPLSVSSVVEALPGLSNEGWSTGTPTSSSSPPPPMQSLANPFKGLHENLHRSYRLDEVLQKAQETDLVFAKQEPKAAVFSFFTLRAGLPTYRQHWLVKETVRRHHEKICVSSFLHTKQGSTVEEGQAHTMADEDEAEEIYLDYLSSSSSIGYNRKTKKTAAVNPVSSIHITSNSKSTSNKRNNVKEACENTTEKDVVRLLPSTAGVADAALRWGGLGWDHPGVEVDYGLLVAQRLLLFPPAERFFHALIGRSNVPCDFFADLDLPDCTLEEGEKTLVEVLDYLEIRLPGVGFTDPFFLVLTNEEPEEMLCSTTTPSSGEENTAFRGIFSVSAHAPMISSPPLVHASRYMPPTAVRNGKYVKRQKVSYHIHARSMTHVISREERSMEELRKVLKKSGSRKKVKENEGKKNGRKKGAEYEDWRPSGSSGSRRENKMGEEEEEEDSITGKGGWREKKTEHVESTEKEGDGRHNCLPSDKKSSNITPKSVKGATKMIAFQDYRVVKLIADEINQTLGFNALDESCYRTSGSLRCAFSRKIPPTMSSTPVSPANAAAAVLFSLGSPKAGYDSTNCNSNSTSVSSHSNKGSPSYPHSTPSIAGLQPALIPLRIRPDQHPDLQKKLHDMHNVLQMLTAPEILELTFCTRHLPEGGFSTVRILQEHLTQQICFPTKNTESIFKATTLHQLKLVKPSAVIGVPHLGYASSLGAAGVASDGTSVRHAHHGAVEYDAYGNAVSPYLTEAAKWRRFKSVVKKLETIPPRAAVSFDIWVRVGLALHNFSNEEHVFEEWVKFSVKCPQKFSREACRKKWLQFERNPDALNWRRGFNYLNQTIWRQL